MIMFEEVAAERTASGPRRFLFLAGCPRSGTTELTSFLNRHPRIYVGYERFLSLYNKKDAVNPSLFEPERFVTLEPGDTFWRSLDEMPDWSEEGRAKYPSADIVGDKAPYALFHIPRLRQQFPDAVFVIAVRDIVSVARSWERRARNSADRDWKRSDGFAVGIRVWLSSMQALARYLLRGPPVCDIFMPQLYCRDIFPPNGGATGHELQRLCSAIGVEPSELMWKRWYGVSHHQGKYVPCSPTTEEKQAVLRELTDVLRLMEDLDECRYRIPNDHLFWPGFMTDFRSVSQGPSDRAVIG
jgi:hypothetical protein